MDSRREERLFDLPGSVPPSDAIPWPTTIRGRGAGGPAAAATRGNAARPAVNTAANAAPNTANAANPTVSNNTAAATSVTSATAPAAATAITATASGSTSGRTTRRKRARAEVVPISPPPTRRVKLQTKTSSPISISSSPGRTTSRQSRISDRAAFFDAIEKEEEFPVDGMSIRGPDDLDEAQLQKCFEILHACGRATDPDATRTTTRHSIEGFLDAIFKDWTTRNPGTLLRSELEFLVEAVVVAGKICGVKTHKTVQECNHSELCKAEVSAVATYTNNPPLFKVEFTTLDTFSNTPEPFCPIARRDIKWASSDWVQELRNRLQSKILAKIHKYNKHLAIWQARRLIVDWAKGSLSMGEAVENMGFLERDTASAVLIGLGVEI